MVYKMVMYVDGGCRGNGYPGAFGACACYVVRKWGRNETLTQRLPASSNPVPTSQRAELRAVILALEHALQAREELYYDPYVEVTIYTDSNYAHNCMTKWYRKWEKNGFLNSYGNKVVNSDLIKKALALERDILDYGDVNWEWIPRCDNQVADEAANYEMNDMENEMEGDSDGCW